jgi:hypothetical protein
MLVFHFLYKKWCQISIIYIVKVTLNIALNQLGNTGLFADNF